MKKVILSFVVSMIYGATVQARVAYSLVAQIDKDGNIIDKGTVVDYVAPSSSSAFYEVPIFIGGVIFAVLVIGFVLILKRRK